MKTQRSGRTIPPHSVEAEQGILGCCLAWPDSLDSLKREPHDLLYDLRHANLFRVLREMHAERQVIDTITAHERLKAKRLLKECGGVQYVASLPETVSSAVNLPYYVRIAREKYAQRKLIQVAAEAQQHAFDANADIADIVAGFQASLDIVTRLEGRSDERPALKVWRAGALLDHKIPTDLRLVGDSELFMGYTTVLAGPGSAGKSLCSTSLALAGAVGSGTWMGRTVHRQFKTLILQAENGATRLKREVEALKRNHPEVNFDEFVFFSEPPDGGLPFHRGNFRAAVREECERLRPDLVIVDPWSQVASEDASKEVIDKVNEIRACIRHGGGEPALLIVAHTKKPRPEDVRKGRGLVYLVSGSIALTNSSRCCYVLLPWTDDMEDSRIYWCCPKLNDGENYAPSVWKRRFGTFFEHDPKTDPRAWGRSEDEDSRHAITSGQLQDAFGKDVELAVRDLVRRLTKLTGCAEQTAYRALSEGEDGYLRPLLMRSGHGKLKFKE